MTTLATAVKNVTRSERDERTARIEAEKQRLDRIAEARANEARHNRIVELRRVRVAETVKAGSTVEFLVPDAEQAMVYRVTVRLTHEDVTARMAARALVIALAHLVSAIESESLTAANGDGVGPDRAKRLAIILDSESGRLATRFGCMTSEMKKVETCPRVNAPEHDRMCTRCRDAKKA